MDTNKNIKETLGFESPHEIVEIFVLMMTTIPDSKSDVILLLSPKDEFGNKGLKSISSTRGYAVQLTREEGELYFNRLKTVIFGERIQYTVDYKFFDYFGIRVEAVVICKRGDTVVAEVFACQQGIHTIHYQAPVSECILLALFSGAPIYIEDPLLNVRKSKGEKVTFVSGRMDKILDSLNIDLLLNGSFDEIARPSNLYEYREWLNSTVRNYPTELLEQIKEKAIEKEKYEWAALLTKFIQEKDKQDDK